MKRKPHSTSLVLLLVCIFTFWWGISVLSQHDLRGSFEVTGQAATPLLVNESFSDGTYTYSGTYMPPSACGTFGSGIRYNASNGGHISILLVSDTSSTDCAQAASVDTGEPFSVSIKLGNTSAPQFDGVFLNGTAIPAQLVEGN